MNIKYIYLFLTAQLLFFGCSKKYILQVITLLLTWSSYAQHDTISIYFTNAESEISSAHEDKIISTFDNLDLDSKYEVQIIGWTDTAGLESENNTLSTDRAFSAYKFITNRFNQEAFFSIEYKGSGEMIEHNSNEKKRQVMIIISKKYQDPDV